MTPDRWVGSEGMGEGMETEAGRGWAGAGAADWGLEGVVKVGVEAGVEEVDWEAEGRWGVGSGAGKEGEGEAAERVGAGVMEAGEGLVADLEEVKAEEEMGAGLEEEMEAEVRGEEKVGAGWGEEVGSAGAGVGLEGAGEGGSGAARVNWAMVGEGEGGKGWEGGSPGKVVGVVQGEEVAAEAEKLGEAVRGVGLVVQGEGSAADQEEAGPWSCSSWQNKQQDSQATA